MMALVLQVDNGAKLLGEELPKAEEQQCSAFASVRSLLVPEGAEAPGGTEEPMNPELAVRLAARCPLTCERLAADLLRSVDKEGRGALDLSQLKATLARVHGRLHLPPPGERDAYLAVAVHDQCGRNVLGAPELAKFVASLLAECALGLAGTSPSGGCSPLQTPPSSARAASSSAPPPSPVDPLRVTLRTLGGESSLATLCTDATTEDLHMAVGRSRLSVAAGQHLFAVGGVVLREGARLDEQGVVPGDDVQVVRVTPPPRAVRIECEGYGLGPSIRGSCGTFVCDSRLKNGRPVYVRDRSLSQWNSAMLYHGAGDRYLVYEASGEHCSSGRWALTDDQDWSSYTDRSYAFVPAEVPHPGYLEGKVWRVYRDARYKKQREWVEHTSLRLVADDQDLKESAPHVAR